MSQTPEEIRADIERTRAGLAGDVNALENKVSPSKVAGRTVDSAKDAVLGAKDKIIGSAHGMTDTVTDTARQTTARTASGAGSAVDTAKAAPDAVKQRASGSPLIAGAVAFGVGYLLSSLLPATNKETALAGAAKEQAQQLVEPAKEQLSSIAGDVRGQLTPAVTEAASHLKETASDAAQTVKQTATDAGSDVAGSARSAGQDVAATARS